MDDLEVVVGNEVSFVIDLTDRATLAPLDVSSNDLQVVLSVRRKGRTDKTDVICIKLVGLSLDDGSVNPAAPYDQTGVGGRCQAVCAPVVFPAPGQYEAEVKVVNAQTTAVTTVHQIFPISARHPF